jgi:predicted metal-dependent peptidase
MSGPSAPSHDAAAARRKLEAARARLILDRPFIGALLMHLPLVESARCASIATDARALYFNPAYIASLSFGDARFMLAHEALHCALLHFHRRGHRIVARWDRACDYCVNLLLADDGFAVPANALLDTHYRGLAAEEIYAMLDDRDEQTLDEHWFGRAGSGMAAIASDRAGDTDAVQLADDAFMDAHRDGFVEVATRGVALVAADALADVWQDRLASSALEAARAGSLGTAFQEALDGLIQPRLPWRALLARFLMSVARDDYGFGRPSRREGDALLPTLRSGQVELVLALDTSGSIDHRAFAEFLAEIDALKGQIRARVTLLACDAELTPGGPWRFETWQPIEMPDELAGGGGTRFTPVFDWLDAQGLRPDALLYFTDAQGEFPLHAPEYPVLWLVKGNAPVPWGERVQLN